MYNKILSKNAMAWCAKNVQSFPKQHIYSKDLVHVWEQYHPTELTVYIYNVHTSDENM